jgi:SAM-dependent methyltransferase
MLAKDVTPGMRYLEIGCAPGLMLAYVVKALGAEVCGLDYSPVGIAQTRAVFDKFALKATLRCEDVFSHTFPREYFDVVHSGGLIEHFEDPRELVRIHVELLKPGGVALITIPHFGGLYGVIAAKTDPGNLAIHNARIMNPASLQELAPQDLSDSVSVRPFGRTSLSNVSFHSSRFLGLLAKAAANAVGLLQPVAIERLCPNLVLRIVRC